MAKRFTDTAKWKKEFIKGLSAKHKLLWFYILDDCDHAGIWEVDLEVAGIRIGEELKYEDALSAIGCQVRIIDKNKWWIKDFIFFQYGNLTPKNKMFEPVMTVLRKYNINPFEKMEDISPINGVKVKDKVQVKDKVEDKVKVEPAEDFKIEYVPREPKDECLQDVETWTTQVIEGNDSVFEVMTRSMKLNGQLERLARDHLGKAARYNWQEKMTTQQAFRHSLLNYITENLNKQPNVTPTKGNAGQNSPEPGKDYSGAGGF